MRIFICTMEDPIYTLPFIKEVIEAREKDIVGVAVSEGNRLTIGKNRSKFAYLLSLLLIMGGIRFAERSLRTMLFKLRIQSSNRFGWVKSPSILAYAEEKGIPTFRVKNVNDPAFVDELRRLEPDVIINQAQNILKKEFLAVPTIGVLNRHNALLPRNRGRLTPFWVAYRDEKQTGVSIHFVTEEIDAGDIVVQEKYEVSPQDNFNSIARKNYEYAPKAMLRALEVLESGEYNAIENDSRIATYNTIPTLKDAFRYRVSRIRKGFQ